MVSESEKQERDAHRADEHDDERATLKVEREEFAARECREEQRKLETFSRSPSSELVRGVDGEANGDELGGGTDAFQLTQRSVDSLLGRDKLADSSRPAPRA